MRWNNVKKNKTTTLVSIKIPAPLYKKLEEKAKEEHYLDISEAIKTIIRNKYLETNNPETRINQLRQEIMKKLETKVNSEVQEKVIEELSNIKNLLERGTAKWNPK